MNADNAGERTRGPMSGNYNLKEAVEIFGTHSKEIVSREFNTHRA